MRTFIAIELDNDIKQRLAPIQKKLIETGADVKWVKIENIHLTLKFLGEIEEKQLPQIKDIIQNICENKYTFNMTINELGAFPKLNYPRVIWIGVKEGKENIERISLELENSLSKIGFKKEKRPFSGHITLGRVRSNKNRAELIEAVNKFNEINLKETFIQPIKTITLFKSTLSLKGPTYEALYTAKFKISRYF